MPLTQMMDSRSSYPENMIFGKICILQKIPESISDGIVTKFRLNGIIFPIVYGILIVFWNLKVQAMIKTHCSTFKTFGCYGGKHRRNLQTFKENLAQSAYWITFIILENMLVAFLRMLSDVLEENTIFLIYNISFFIFGDLAIGFLLPIKYLMLSTGKYQILWMSTHMKKNVVVEKSTNTSIKIPRRETTPTMITKTVESLENRANIRYTFNNIIEIPRVTVVEID